MDVEETAIGSRMRQRSGKKWRRLAREPANKLDLSLVDLGQHIDKTKQNKEATSSKKQDLLAPKPFTVLAVCPKSDLFWTAVG